MPEKPIPDLESVELANRKYPKPKTGLTEVAATLDDFETEPGDLVSRLKRCSISDTSESSQKVEPQVRNSFDLKL